MASFAINNQLRVGRFLVDRFHTLLQLQHNGARRVNQLDPVGCRQSVRLRRLAVSSQEYFCIAQLCERSVVDRLHPKRLQALHLAFVVDDVAQTEERRIVFQLAFSLLDGRGYAVAEARMYIYFYLHKSSLS